MKKNVCKSVALTCAFFILFIFSNCRGSKTETTTEETTDTTTTQENKQKSITSVSIWIDESASMKGYFSSGVEQNILTVIAAVTNVAPCKGVSFYGHSLGQTIAYSDFKDRVENGNALSGDESNLKSMIETAVSKVGKGSLVFIVTDGIMSGSDKQIRESRDRKYNIIHRGDLTQEIKNMLSNKKDISISVAQYKSSFNGTYICYNNDKKRLSEKIRPFYLIVIGKKEIVSLYMKTKMADKLKTENFVTYGIEGMPYTLKIRPWPSDFFKFDSKKKAYAMTKKYSVDKEEDIIFKVSISNLPKYMQAESYLKTNGHLQCKASNASDDSYKDMDVQMSVSQGVASYVIDRNKIKGSTFRYILNYSNPQWVANSSTDDDIMNYSDTTTFNLLYFMDGLSVLNSMSDLNGRKTVNKVESSIVKF